MLNGKPRFRTVCYDLDVARAERRAFIEAAPWGVIAAAPSFGTAVEWRVGRFAGKVASGERRERTLELHHYHLDRHLSPELSPREKGQPSGNDCGSSQRLDVGVQRLPDGP